jgi:ABC-type transport system involved in multi-copper enzyme maturation permease subunit
MPGKSDLTDIMTVASKEFLDDLRSKRLLLIGIFYVGIGLLLSGGVWFVYTQGWLPMVFITVTPADVVLNVMSVASIILVILAIILPSDSVSQEKSSRTIYQLLSKPVKRHSVIIGKYLGSLSVISFLFVISALLSYVLTTALTGVLPDAGRVAIIALALLAMLLLLAVYVAIGILVSTVTRNPLISIVVSLLVWVGFLAIDIAAFILGIFSIMGSIATTAVTTSGSVVDTYSLYPWYVKMVMWIDPGSHNVMGQILNGSSSGLVSGLPMWANVVILLAYTGIALAASIVIFERQDL